MLVITEAQGSCKEAGETGSRQLEASSLAQASIPKQELLSSIQTFLPSGPVLPRSPGTPAEPPLPCKARRGVYMKHQLSRPRILAVPCQKSWVSCLTHKSQAPSDPQHYPLEPRESQSISCRLHTVSQFCISSTNQHTLWWSHSNAYPSSRNSLFSNQTWGTSGTRRALGSERPCHMLS